MNIFKIRALFQRSAPDDDIPGVEARAMRCDTGRPVRPAPGKHVSDFDTHVAQIIPLVRPQRLLCRCGAPATISIPARERGKTPERVCPNHRPLGVLGVVTGGDVA